MKFWKVDIAESEEDTLKEFKENAVSYWAELKDKLVKKFELEHPELSTIFMKRTLIASGIPTINERPSFILHSLPNISDNSGHLSLYELLCKTFGIYLSLSAGNGFINLGSQDMDVSIDELGKHLIANDPEKTLSMHLIHSCNDSWPIIHFKQTFRFHNQDYYRNFTPKQWLLMQLSPRKISGEDFWVPIHQKKLPIMIDESQVAINFSTDKLCLVPSGTGMSFDDIKIHAATAIAKSGDATYMNFVDFMNVMS
ncbi:hypothetical protein RhiirB3_523013 [Rhizophagus irregularis]|nr:hypothetical protein RhiirB3_523013 [Rhizophagus irregularis]